MAPRDLPAGTDETETRSSGFSSFFVDAEPRLRRAFVAAYGGQRGREATSEALAWAWENWEAMGTMANPLGYLYRVGRSRSRPRRTPVEYVVPAQREPWVEPELAPSLARLTERQRVAVVLIHGFGWTHREVAELTGTSITTVQNHLERGLAHLRTALGVDDG